MSRKLTEEGRAGSQAGARELWSNCTLAVEPAACVPALAMAPVAITGPVG